jgi:hypothetical protein
MYRALKCVCLALFEMLDYNSGQSLNIPSIRSQLITVITAYNSFQIQRNKVASFVILFSQTVREEDMGHEV